MGLFGAVHGWGAKSLPSSKICHTYPTMMKLGVVISYLKGIQKVYESRETSAFSHRISANFAILRNTDILIYLYTDIY